MSPRAAWRLEALGYVEVYDYVAGKSDWMAAGLPTEGNRTHPPRVAQVMDRSVATCGAGERLVDVAARVAPSGTEFCVVLNERGVVQGRGRWGRGGPAPGRLGRGGMEPGPATPLPAPDVS